MPSDHLCTDYYDSMSGTWEKRNVKIEKCNSAVFFVVSFHLICCIKFEKAFLIEATR